MYKVGVKTYLYKKILKITEDESFSIVNYYNQDSVINCIAEDLIIHILSDDYIVDN